MQASKDSHRFNSYPRRTRCLPLPLKTVPAKYCITSVQHEKYLGDDQAGGVLSPYPIVLLDTPILPPKFTVTKSNEINTYTITVNENMVHNLDDRVISYNDESTTEWVIIFRQHERAYTIERKVESSLAWTAPELEPDRPSNPLQILLKPLVCTYSIPPQFLPSQLFKFES
ncbi:hypothetical protein F5J12DRAFT_352389 [Pisolithus orientalis]|uniref:uncharacterized protein n=1 Tax=Pisolithus orientalis TaxID=936130 RepID=UPI002223F3DC|nr:uncharacterized protein F5J12DRAFT_352389 [Pisolithus orientalis]KAI5996603.1 hypothetical protein F5J12DRAFT_352389 [Pisolithus orientalis]